MAKNVLERMTQDADAATAPWLVDRTGINLSAIDPCGLRETNFDMMNELCDGLNNVARHIRPLCLVSWAWRRGLKIAETSGRSVADVEEIEAFVTRCETIFSWSCFLDPAGADIPGSQAMGSILSQQAYRFEGSHWNAFAKQRRISTGFSAPANYGPGLRSFGWAKRNSSNERALVPSEEAAAALDAFEARLGDIADHPAFTSFNTIEVTADEVRSWTDVWKLDTLTEQERAHMRRALIGDLSTPTRREGVGLLLAAAEAYPETNPAGSAGVTLVRRAASGEINGFVIPVGFEDAAVRWRRLQVRQLFRYALECLLAWTVDTLSSGPKTSDRIVSAFLEQAGIHPELPASSAWLETITADASLSAATDSIAVAIRAPRRSGLAAAIARALALTLANSPAEQASFDRVNRLPIKRAADQARARSHLPARELARHVIESWVLAQHVYWAVGRGINDARSNGDRKIMRLQVSLEEGGWQALPSARLAPEPTPDRIRTALSLASEAGLIA